MTLERLRASLADRYRIERELGQGGTATVYLAQDLKHERQVAIKVLRPELAAVLGADRFIQEIKTTAGLQHPHILPLFDSGQADGFLYYVMPYIEGETLRTRLDREHQLGVDEAVKITTDVADALDYAHRQGVIHRDIKPENILLHVGRPMVADFGIALAVSAAAGGRMTETGLSLGTPHYMSPEQATAEKNITARSDVYSLGAVLYELLTGQPPHLGGSAQQIIMKIVTEPAAPVTQMRKSVPPNVAGAVAKALEKLPADRFESAAGFARALNDPHFTTAMAGAAGSGAASAVRHQQLLVGMVVITVLAVLAAVWAWLRPAAEAPTSRFAVAMPAGMSIGSSVALGSNITLSRDGRMLVFLAADSAGHQMLWLKREGEVTPTPIQGTENAYEPFLSPDGAQLGFFVEIPKRAMEIVTLGGGAPREISSGTLGQSGASWARDGFIYFDAGADGIQRCHPDGSGLEPVLALDTKKREIGYAWPVVLPGDKVIIARLRRAGDTPAQFDLIASRIGSRQRTVVTRAVLARFYHGHLFYVTADGTLRVSRFDQGRLSLQQPATVLAGGLRVSGGFAAVDLTVSGSGTMYYVAGTGGPGSTLEWVDSAGRHEPADPSWKVPFTISGLSLRPDGRQVAIAGSDEGRSNIWIKDLPVGPMTRLTNDSARDLDPSWSADGQSVLYTAFRDKVAEIRLRRANGLGGDSLVMRSARNLYAQNQSRDGRWLVATIADSMMGTSRDVVVMEKRRDSIPRPLITTPERELSPVISPDGHWLAYRSDRSGRSEIYVQPFPDVDSGRWQVSIDGGHDPRWSPKGDRLFFVSISGSDLMVTDITTSPAFKSGVPHRFVGRMTDAVGWSLDLGYAVGPDAKRILVVDVGTSGSPGQLIRVEHPLSDIGKGGSK